MKFKNFKNRDKGRSFNEESARLENDFKEFFDEVLLSHPDINHKEWQEEVLFIAFLKPDIARETLLAENIEKYLKEVFFKDYQLK